jgi:cell division septum initiation protein DivIVA
LLPYDESNFELSLMGYNRRQVDRHIDDLNRRLEEATIAFDAAVALQNQLNDARTEIAKLRSVTRTLPNGMRIGDRITEILAAAEQQAAVIRAQAAYEADERQEYGRRDQHRAPVS